MDDTKPRLFTDGRGVWRERWPGHPSVIEWGDIYTVGGHKLDAVTEVYTCVELGTEYGEFVELYHDWPGFVGVVAALTERLSGIAPDWYQRIEQLGPSDSPIEAWRRQQSGSPVESDVATE